MRRASLGRRPVVEKINRQVSKRKFLLFIGTMALHAMGLENRTNFFFKGVNEACPFTLAREAQTASRKVSK